MTINDAITRQVAFALIRTKTKPHTLRTKQRRRQKEHEKDENCFVFSFGAVEMSQGLQIAGLQHSNLESSAK